MREKELLSEVRTAAEITVSGLHKKAAKSISQSEQVITFRVAYSLRNWIISVCWELSEREFEEEVAMLSGWVIRRCEVFV